MKVPGLVFDTNQNTQATSIPNLFPNINTFTIVKHRFINSNALFSLPVTDVTGEDK